MSSDSDRPDDGARGVVPDRVEVLVALAAVALGLFVLVGSVSIDLGAGYDRIGPRFFPYVVAVGLLISGSLLARGALRRRSVADETRHSQTRWAGIGTLSLALGLSVLLLDRAGFILTSTLLFWLVAQAFESRRHWRDVVVSLLLSVAVYLAFTRGLGLVLPGGLLERLF